MPSQSDPEQSSTEPTQEELREGSRSKQQGPYRAGSVVLWWVLGCAVGGMLGGFGRILEHLFLLPVFFGGLLGIAQVLVLRSYLPRGTGLWIVASFFGWFTGFMAKMILGGVLPPPYGLDPFFLYDFVTWAVFGLAQGLVLWAVLGLRFAERDGPLGCRKLFGRGPVCDLRIFRHTRAVFNSWRWDLGRDRACSRLSRHPRRSLWNPDGLGACSGDPKGATRRSGDAASTRSLF